MHYEHKYPPFMGSHLVVDGRSQCDACFARILGKPVDELISIGFIPNNFPRRLAKWYLQRIYRIIPPRLRDQFVVEYFPVKKKYTLEDVDCFDYDNFLTYDNSYSWAYRQNNDSYVPFYKLSMKVTHMNPTDGYIILTLHRYVQMFPNLVYKFWKNYIQYRKMYSVDWLFLMAHLNEADGGHTLLKPTIGDYHGIPKIPDLIRTVNSYSFQNIWEEAYRKGEWFGFFWGRGDHKVDVCQLFGGEIKKKAYNLGEKFRIKYDKECRELNTYAERKKAQHEYYKGLNNLYISELDFLKGSYAL